MDIVSRGNSVSELPSLPRDSCKTPITMTQEGPDGSAQGSFPGGWIKATALPEQALLQKVTSAPADEAKISRDFCPRHNPGWTVWALG